MTSRILDRVLKIVFAQHEDGQDTVPARSRKTKPISPGKANRQLQPAGETAASTAVRTRKERQRTTASHVKIPSPIQIKPNVIKWARVKVS